MHEGFPQCFSCSKGCPLTQSDFSWTRGYQRSHKLGSVSYQKYACTVDWYSDQFIRTNIYFSVNQCESVATFCGRTMSPTWPVVFQSVGGLSWDVMCIGQNLKPQCDGTVNWFPYPKHEHTCLSLHVCPMREWSVSIHGRAICELNTNTHWHGTHFKAILLSIYSPGLTKLLANVKKNCAQHFASCIRKINLAMPVRPRCFWGPWANMNND